MKIKLFITGVMAASTIVANAQSERIADDCRCEESFEWMRSTFETNDAGFGYIVERKGRVTYDLHNRITLEKARAATNVSECRDVLGEWLLFFRNAHIGLQMLVPDPAAAPISAPAPQMAVSTSAAVEPYLETLNATTIYLRIPSFNPRHKPAIDKIVADNLEAITSTANLIIDVRGNGGGFSTSYSEIMPLLYTNPIRTPGFAYYATPLNIEKTEELLDTEGIDEETHGQISALVEKMKARPGEFVPEGEEEIMVETFDNISEYPRNVGIMIDRRCGSATEMFLLAARQSRKVKLFGTTTLGSHDVSDVRTADSPDGRYRLRYATSRSLQVPGMVIDEIGIQPDFYFDRTIPGNKWVEYVSDMLNSAANEE